MNFKSYIIVFGGLASAGILLFHSVGYSYGLMIDTTFSSRQEITFNSMEVRISLLTIILVFMIPFLNIMNFVKPQNILRVPSSILIIFTGIIKGLAILYKPHSLLSWQIIFVISCILIVVGGSLQFLDLTEDSSQNDLKVNEKKSISNLVGVFSGIIILLSVVRFSYFIIESNKINPTDSINPSNWSPYMGQMTWDSADAKCKSLGLKLPTIEEIKVAYNAGLTKSWGRDGNYYWSSTPYDNKMYYGINVNDGFVNYYFRTFNNDVRCHH